VASWTARFPSSDDADAAAEHEEMVNELQAVVLIGNQWANAADDPVYQQDSGPSNFDPDTATGNRVANEDDELWNGMDRSTTDEVDGSGTATPKMDTVEDGSKNLYSTITRSTSIAAAPSSMHAVDAASVVERPSSTCDRDQLLPFPVYEDARPPRDTSPPPSTASWRCAVVEVHASGVEVLSDAEAPQIQQTVERYDDGDSVPVTYSQELDNADKEAERLDELAVQDDENSSPQPSQPCVPSLHCEEEQTPRRASQLSKTLKNNLERLLQRGPVSAATATASSRRRRKMKRDAGLVTSGKQQATTSNDGKQQHRRHHHQHHHPHQHHRRRRHQQQQQGCDAHSVITNTDTLRSISASSVSGVSSTSDGMFTLKLLILFLRVYS